MSTPANRLDAVAVALAATLDAAEISLDGSGLKVYSAEPRDLDRLPAATISGPIRFRRTEPDQRESQLGSRDWLLTYRLRVYTPLDDPTRGQEGMRTVLGQIIAAIDVDETLGGEVEIEAKLTNGDQSFSAFTDSEGKPTRQFVLFECDLVAWVLQT